MQYYRCSCGQMEAWASMPMPRCCGCKKCGTTLALIPEMWMAPDSHDFVATSVETDNGSATLSRCRYCGRNRSEVLKEDADGFFVLNGQKYLTIGPVHGVDVRVKLPPECAGYELQDDSGRVIGSSEIVPAGSRVTAVPPAKL